MHLYIDKKNLESIASNSDHPIFHECMTAMRQDLDVCFNFLKEEIMQNESLLAWFKLFTSGIAANRQQKFLETPFPERPVKSNAYIHFNIDQLSSAYLIDDDKLENLSGMGALLIGKPGEEFEVFSQLFLRWNKYKYDKKLKIGGPTSGSGLLWRYGALPSPARPWRIDSWRHIGAIPINVAGLAGAVFGPGRDIPTISSNGWSGWPGR